VNKQS